ncbi:MAG TPA: septal ring lytic transglycosylase RlpA family protein [Thermoanaerobaculia bacterium]|nr:septal ring lytic transglycosylase RlpA family protein [Thermoanaerobaculia bacterium]
MLFGLGLAACSSTPKAVSPAAAPAQGAIERGLASWYGKEFDGLPTASGETFRPEKISAAHRTLPLGTVVDVTNEKNGRSVRVKVNDRGPFVAGRIVDLSKAAAAEIGSVGDGVVPVTLRVVTLGDNSRIRAKSDEPPVPTPANTATKGEPGAPAVRPASTGWAVQAGAFGSPENAVKLRERLAARYPSPWVEDFKGLRRVKFGPYATKAEAEAARDSLGDLGLAGIVVEAR